MRLVAAGGAMALSLLGWSMPILAQTPPTPAAGAAVTAPAPGPAASTEDMERLRQRAAEFWAARVALDAAKQYELLEPRGRGRMTVAEYAGAPRAVKYLAYQVEDASVRGYFANVKIKLIVQPMLPMSPQRRVAPAAVAVNETWVRVGGTWYRALEQEEGRGPAELQR